MARRTDIYLQIDPEEKAYIINVTIVTEWQPKHMHNKYKPLQELIRDKRIKQIKIIPVVITINGFIYKKSLDELRKLELKIDFTKIIRTLTIRQMKEVMFYLFNEDVLIEE